VGTLRNMRNRRLAYGVAGAVLLGAGAMLLLPRMRDRPRDVAPVTRELVEPPVPHLPAATERAIALVSAGVGEAYPGAAVAVGEGARVERVSAVGRIGWRDASPLVLADTTLYDVASLTKVMATTMAVLLLVQDGVIELDDPVRRHLPGFEGEGKERVTWRHLLTHTSGLPAGAVVRGSTDAERLRRLLRTKLGMPPGTTVTYSDIGYVVAYAAAERAAGEPLPKLLKRRVWEPLGMDATRFSPGRGCEDCAPTLRLKTGEPFRGLPSDPLARQLGGVAGHAGLFSTIRDVARFTAMVANGGELDGVRILEPALAREMLTQQPRAGRRTLGWTAFCPDEPPGPSRACERPMAVGHNGWSGTSIWLDPERGYWVALLTNRSYERANRPFPLDGLRRELFLQVAGVESDASPRGWLARATAPRDTTPVRPAPAPPRGGVAR
jgi:CubicO group peptidase (beta-lactamase class C family)